MSFFKFRGRKVPYLDDSVQNPAALGADDVRRAAWAFAIGQRSQSGDPQPGRRTSRADLPDVDFSRAVPVCAPSRLQRLARWLGLARPLPEPAADEWRVLHRLSEPPSSDRRNNNVVSMNHAA